MQQNLYKRVLFVLATLTTVLSCTNNPKQQNGGSYLVGDFHHHTTYTDGSYTIGYVMQKNAQYLDWWANSEHGGRYPRWGAVWGGIWAQR